MTTALVIGGTSGVGLAVARQLVGRGRAVHIAGRNAERYNRIIAEEFLYARTWLYEDQRRKALGVWNVHYNYHRPHSGAGGRPPTSRLADHVTNGLASYIQVIA